MKEAPDVLVLCKREDSVSKIGVRVDHKRKDNYVSVNFSKCAADEGLIAKAAVQHSPQNYA